MFKYIAILMVIPSVAYGGGQTFGEKKPYTRQQKINRGELIEKKLTTCRLKKIVTGKSGAKACVYQGGNKTYKLIYEDNCPRQYKCAYDPWGKEPNIDDVIDSLNAIGKK